MKRFASLIVTSIALFCGSPVVADVNGFDCDFPLTGGDTSLRQFVLHEAAHACFERRDYADLTVVNSAGEAVPWQWIEPDRPNESALEERPIAFYTEPAPPAYETGEQLRRIAQLTGLSPRTMNDEQWQEANCHYSSVILELTEPLEALKQISIEVSREGEPVAATLMVEQSPDLEHWTTLAWPQVIRFLGEADRELLHNRVTLDASNQAKYLRLAILSRLRDFAGNIDRVVGHFETSESAAQGLDLHWLLAPGFQPLDGEGTWRVHLPGRFPISRLRFTPAPGRLFYIGRVYVRPSGGQTGDAPSKALYKEGRDRVKNRFKEALEGNIPAPTDPDAWRYKTPFNTYWLTTQTGTASRSELSFPQTHSRHWKFVFDGPAGLSREQLPHIEFGWRPRRVRFLTQGEGPFRLQVGHKQPAPRPAFPKHLDGAAAETVLLLAETSGPTPAGRAPQAALERLDWSRLLLWALLLAGLGLMSVMAYRLWRNMDSGS